MRHHDLVPTAKTTKWGSVPRRSLLAVLLSALVLSLAGAVMQTSPRNVRVSYLPAAADTLAGTAQWVQPQRLGTPALTGYEWRVLDGEVTVVSGTTTASVRTASFRFPFPCGVTLSLRFAVRATNSAWPTPGPWAQTAITTMSRTCQPEAAGAPQSVTMTLDTVAGGGEIPPEPPPDSLPDLALVSLDCWEEPGGSTSGLWVTAVVEGQTAGPWYGRAKLLTGTLVRDTRDRLRWGELNFGERWVTWDGTQSVAVTPWPDGYPVSYTVGFDRPATEGPWGAMWEVDVAGQVAEGDETNNASMVGCRSMTTE